MEDAMENRKIPTPSPRPLPRGEGEHANALSRFGECRLRSHAPKLGATAARPSPTRPNALTHSALPDEPSGSPSPLGRGRGEGEGISLSFKAFFSAAGSGLNSTENSEEPSGLLMRFCEGRSWGRRIRRDHTLGIPYQQRAVAEIADLAIGSLVRIAQAVRDVAHAINHPVPMPVLVAVHMDDRPEATDLLIEACTACHPAKIETWVDILHGATQRLVL